MQQSIVAIIIFVTSVIIGVVMEKMILDGIIPSVYASVIMICFSVILILFFFIFIQMSLHNQSEVKRVALQTRLHDEEVRINEIVQWSTSVRTLRHDLNNHLIAIKQCAMNKDFSKPLNYISKMENSMTDVPQLSGTNHASLNAILDVKRMVCQRENIDLKCYLQSDLPEFDSYSLCTVLGNLMDNAIEAEMKEIEREICLAIMSENGHLRITVQNKVETPILIDGKLPNTSKTDKQNHGIAMKSIIETVDKNLGVIDIYEKDGWFVVDVFLLCDS